MQTETKKSYFQILFSSIAISILMYSCANMASPQGGDYDFDPPVVVKSNPTPNQVNVKSGKIEIIFDELIQIEKPLEKVIITPPQSNFPVIRSQSNKVIVELKDTLLPNTTYTIDFTDAIVDNNEKNALENFSISFSTGDVVDSLQISGKVLAADNLEPVAGIYVGIHSDLSDTAFTKKPFLRISRTNEQGFFSIKGVAEGKYKVYALNDLNRDYMYDNLGETIAFWDTVVSPYTEKATRNDSIFKINPKNIKEILLDSLVAVSYTKYLPDDIILRSFQSPFKRQYLQKHERTSDDHFSLFFGAPTSQPTIEAIDPKIDIKDWTIVERNATNDSLTYWINTKEIAEMDTLKLKVSYFETDTLNMPQLKTDTLNFIDRNKSKRLKEKEAQAKKKKKDKDEPKVDLVNIKTNIGQSVDVYRKINLEFDTPVKDFGHEKIKLQEIVDTIYTDLDFNLTQDSLNPRKFELSYEWRPDGNYELKIDSASVCNYFDICNKGLDLKFKVKNSDQYGNLLINIQSLPQDMPAFVELLDKSDKTVRKSEVKDGSALFLYLDPGTYYARIVLDRNGNGVWDAGDFDKKLEPEMVYYYDKSFDIKANWDIEEDWDITAVPLEKQKPLDITKNKPKSDEAKRKQMERRDAQNNKKRNQQNNTQTNNQNGLNNSQNTTR